MNQCTCTCHEGEDATADCSKCLTFHWGKPSERLNLAVARGVQKEDQLGSILINVMEEIGSMLNNFEERISKLENL